MFHNQTRFKLGMAQGERINISTGAQEMMLASVESKSSRKSTKPTIVFFRVPQDQLRKLQAEGAVDSSLVTAERLKKFLVVRGNKPEKVEGAFQKIREFNQYTNEHHANFIAEIKSNIAQSKSRNKDADSRSVEGNSKEPGAGKSSPAVAIRAAGSDQVSVPTARKSETDPDSASRIENHASKSGAEAASLSDIHDIPFSVFAHTFANAMKEKKLKRVDSPFEKMPMLQPTAGQSAAAIASSTRKPLPPTPTRTAKPAVTTDLLPTDMNKPLNQISAPAKKPLPPTPTKTAEPTVAADPSLASVSRHHVAGG